MFGNAQAAGADLAEFSSNDVVQRKPVRVRSADEDAVHRDFIDRRADLAAARLKIDVEVTWQLFASALVFALALFEQYRATRLQPRGKHRHSPAGLRDMLAMGSRFLCSAIDFRGAVADRDDELRGGGSVDATSRWSSRSARRPRR